MTTEHGLTCGQILSDRYELKELLGRGGMGQVFLATDRETGDSVALKSLQAVSDAIDRKRFEREIRALQKLKHPNIVALREPGWQDDVLFFTMDYHPCVTLEDVIKARGAVTESAELDWYLRVLLQVTRALSYLHDRHFVHRDVKPANILLRIPGLTDDLPPPQEWVQFDNTIAFLTDFGLVKARDMDASLTRTALGTPQYMAPEQIEASPAVDERSDLYSLGVMIYRIAVGQLPFDTLSSALSRDAARPIREYNPDLPALLEETTERLLHFEPFRRPADAREVEDLLRSVLDRKVQRSTGQRAIKLLQPSFCGRTAELRRLKKYVADSRRGIGRWASIQGERSTGKSWLIHRSDLKSSTLIHEKMSLFSGSFRPKAPHAAFGSLLEDVLSHVERHHGTDAAVHALGPRGRLIERLLPDHLLGRFLKLTPTIEALPTEFVREHVIDTVVRALTAGAEMEPRVLVLEDLHYAAKLDVEILRRLLIASIQLPILVITTGRSDAQTRLPALERLLQEIRAEGRVEEIETKPFTTVEVRQMVESLFLPAHAVSSEFVDAVFERTDGVPLYVLHLVNSLWSRDAIQLTDGVWTTDPEEVRSLPIPKSTRSHFLLILDEVPTDELRVLNVAAILGSEFSFDQLLAVSEIDEIDLGNMCRNLVHTGILQERKNGYRFAHAFEQEIVLSKLSPPMKSRLHRRAGEVLERLAATDHTANAADIGEHFYHGGQLQRAYDYLMHAGQKAENMYSPSVALGYYQKALESTSESRRRDLLIVIGSLEQALGNSKSAREHFDQARGLFRTDEDTPGPLTAEQRGELKSFHDLLIRTGDFHGKLGEIPLALDSYERAARVAHRIDDTAAIAHASMRKGSALAAAERWAEAEVAFESAVQRFEDLAPSAGIVSALNGLSFAAGFRGDSDGALRHARRGLEIADEIKDRVRSAGILSTIGTILRRKGLFDEAIASFEQAVEIQEELADQRGLSRSLGNLGVSHVMRGDFRKGLNNQEKAREICRALGDTKSLLQISGNIGQLQILRGSFAEARETLTEYLSEFRRLGVQRFVADGLLYLGVLDLECGNLDDAERQTREGIAEFDLAGYPNLAQDGRVHLARVLRRKGDNVEAERLCREMIERHRTDEPNETYAEALRVTAEARLGSGDPESAEEPALQALAIVEALSLPQHEGLACRTLGKVYRELGFYWADQTANYLERAMTSFERLESRHALAVTKLEYGSFLLMMDDIDDARRYFEEAMPVFAELGMQAELERTRRELEEIN